jgi:hypothetical protein
MTVTQPSLVTHPLLDVGEITAWHRATKTKAIKAKHIQHLFADNSVLSKFMLATLEGQQMLKATSMVCVGAEGDVWQQAQDKLLKKYKVASVDEGGWLVCEPYPDNEVDCYDTMQPFMPVETTGEGFSIKAQWGERQSDGTFLQFGQWGDFICRNQTDKTDVWIVRRSFFDSTYEIKQD